MLPTFIEDENVSEKVGRNDQTRSGSMPANIATEERNMIDSNNNDVYVEKQILNNESANKLLDSRLRDYLEKNTPVELECDINQR